MYLFEPPLRGMWSTIVGARDSVPSFGALNRPLPCPGSGGGVASTIGLDGFGVGAVEEAALLVIEVIWAGLGMNAGGGAGARVYGFAAAASSWRARVADCTADGEGPVEVPVEGPVEGFMVGEGTILFDVGDGGTEVFCIFIWCWKKDCAAMDGDVDAWCGGSTRLAMDGDALARFDGCAGLGDICA